MTQAPRPLKRPHQHLSPYGQRQDPYHWLRDDSREDPLVRKHLEDENAHFEAYRRQFKDLEDALYNEMLGRIEEDDCSPPICWHGDWYYSETHKGQAHAIEMRKRGSQNVPAEILLDPNQRGAGLAFYEVGNWTVSGNGRYLAWAEDTVGRRQYTIRLRDLEKGQDLPDTILNCSSSLAFASDGKTLLYVLNELTTLRSYRVMRHHIGGRVDRDKLIYEEHDESFYTDVQLSTSERFLMICVSSTVSDEVRVIPAKNPRKRPALIAPRSRNVHYEADHMGQCWVIRTDWRAPDGRLMAVPEWQIGSRENWQTLLPAQRGLMLESFELFREAIALEERIKGTTRIRVLNWDLEEIHRINPQDESGTLSLDSNPDPGSHRLRYSDSSLITPDQIREYDFVSGEEILIKSQVLPSGYDRSNYQSLRLWAPARDGAHIPITILSHAHHSKEGSGALLVYGYGAYGSIIDPDFRVSALSLADRGVAFAILHIRGGEDLGRHWYDNGRMMNKCNSFYDFIDATEWLIQQGWAAPDRVCAEGGSAGGLLMGAVANLRPDLYRAMILQVPFLDCLSTMEDASLPLTTNEYDEWGNPEKAHHYRSIAAWSPYDNLRAANYPQIFATTGLHDSQVQYWEPVKWIAKLRDLKTDDYPALLHVDLTAGHGGPSGRYARLREIATDYAFALHCLG